MRIGITATRKGLKPSQSVALASVLAQLQERGAKALHHGLCVGGDEEAHDLARDLGLWIETHPGKVTKSWRSDREGDRTHPERPPLERNRVIVDSVDVLVALPRTMSEELRSGTWATIRYAIDKGIKVIIVWPNGAISEGIAGS